MTEDLRLLCAPMQGLTEAAFRAIHSREYNNGVEYYTPFIRVERGEVRPRDIADWQSPLNEGINIIPQIIFRDVREFDILVGELIARGAEHIDLNLGCPFPPQVKKGRGAGMLGCPDRLAEVMSEVGRLMGNVKFSIKMRLGINDATQWHSIIDIISNAPLTHITVHPRTASQQYSGSLYLDEFKRLVDALPCPVIFNGDVLTPDDIANLRRRFPELSGVMVGRGLFYRPSLFNEWRRGIILSNDQLRANALKFHKELAMHYGSTLCGDSQILSKVKPLTEFLEPYIERKTIKKLVKTHRFADYCTVLNSI